jgi:hypothetical protein
MMLKTEIIKREVSTFIQLLMAAIAVEITNEIVNKKAIANINPNENNLAFKIGKIPF